MIDYSTLETGQELSKQSLTLDPDAVSKYVCRSGNDTSNPTAEDGTALVPPMAIAALALSAVISALQIPGGTIHASQEIEFGFVSTRRRRARTASPRLRKTPFGVIGAFSSSTWRLPAAAAAL